MNLNPIYLTDFYKINHRKMYPQGTNLIFSNFTPRKSRLEGVNHSIFFGLQYFLKKYLEEDFNKYFNSGLSFSDEALAYNKFMDKTLGHRDYPHHIEELLYLGYLPIEIYALPELSIVPCGIPALVIFNTDPKFFWLPNYLETLLSCTLWGACTSATIAYEYRKLLDNYAIATSDNLLFVDYQAHDFSFRGMSSVESACISGMSHLQYFNGTDTIPALIFNKEYYGHPYHIASVPATEHSVMSAGGKEHEYATFERLITDTYPSGIISIVSDTWNLWGVISDILPRLKSTILSRDGKVVIRPDSGDPVDILCGNHRGPSASLPGKGVVECLWDIFGGKVNSKGFKELDEHIGVIYGDSITLDRAQIICERLREKGYASTNIVFGIGSYSYQYNTRDTLGWAMKSTYIEIDGVGRAISKDPVTDDGMKKSAQGLLKVVKVDGAHGSSFELFQNQTWSDFYMPDNALKLAYSNGKIYK